MAHFAVAGEVLGVTRQAADSVLRTRNPGTGTRRFEKSILRTENPGTGILNPWAPALPQPPVGKSFVSSFEERDHAAVLRPAPRSEITWH